MSSTDFSMEKAGSKAEVSVQIFPRIASSTDIEQPYLGKI
jgi:hypothetical protein